MADAIENSPVILEKTKDASSSLSNQSFDTMLQSFSPNSTPAEALGDYISLNSIFPADATKPLEPEKYASEKIKFELTAKGGEHCRLVSDVNAADQAVAQEPKLELRIANADATLDRANDVLRIVGDKLRNGAAEQFTKKDWQQLEALGPNPFGDPKGKLGPIEFNPAQRAWLRENHPALYKQLENNDLSTLSQRRASAEASALHAIQDGPVQARLELARYLSKVGDHDGAVGTLTEIARRTRTPSQEKEFRNAAQQTDAAWDPGFRKAIERSGGNILDYVQRPERYYPKQEFMNKKKF